MAGVGRVVLGFALVRRLTASPRVLWTVVENSSPGDYISFYGIPFKGPQGFAEAHRSIDDASAACLMSLYSS